MSSYPTERSVSSSATYRFIPSLTNYPSLTSYPVTYQTKSVSSQSDKPSPYNLTSVWWLGFIILIVLILFIVFSIFFVFIPLRNAENKVNELAPIISSAAEDINTLTPTIQQIGNDLNQLTPTIQQVGSDINKLTPEIETLVSDVDMNFSQILNDLNALPQIQSDLKNVLTFACQLEPTLSFCTTANGTNGTTTPGITNGNNGTDGTTAPNTTNGNNRTTTNPFVDPTCQLNKSSIQFRRSSRK